MFRGVGNLRLDLDRGLTHIHAQSIDDLPEGIFGSDPAHLIAFGMSREGAIHIVITSSRIKFGAKIMLSIGFLKGYFYLASIQLGAGIDCFLLEMENGLVSILKYFFETNDRFRALLMSFINYSSKVISDVYFVSRNGEKSSLIYYLDRNGLYSDLIIMGCPRLTPADGIIAVDKNCIFYLSPLGVLKKNFADAKAWQRVFESAAFIEFLGRFSRSNTIMIHYVGSFSAEEVDFKEKDNELFMWERGFKLVDGYLITDPHQKMDNVALVSSNETHGLVTLGECRILSPPMGMPV